MSQEFRGVVRPVDGENMTGAELRLINNIMGVSAIVMERRLGTASDAVRNCQRGRWQIWPDNAEKVTHMFDEWQERLSAFLADIDAGMYDIEAEDGTTIVQLNVHKSGKAYVQAVGAEQAREHTFQEHVSFMSAIFFILTLKGVPVRAGFIEEEPRDWEEVEDI